MDAAFNLTKFNLRQYEHEKEKFKTQGYVLYDHAQVINDICKKHNLIITVRKTGKYSLEKIGEGNPCKGHDILDKTIKPKSLEAKNIKLDTIKQVYYGYVGTWGTNKLLGVKALAERENPIGEHYGITEITLDHLNVPNQNVFTGDYDLHDIIHKGGSGNPYSVVSKAEKIPQSMNREDILNLINIEIWKKDNSRLENAKKYSTKLNGYNTKTNQLEELKDLNDFKTWENPYALIRHGAQRDYWSYAVQEREKFVFAVMQMDAELIAFTGKEDYYILKTLQDVKNFYEKFKINKPSSWVKEARELWEDYGKVLTKSFLESKDKDPEKEKMMTAFWVYTLDETTDKDYFQRIMNATQLSEDQKTEIKKCKIKDIEKEYQEIEKDYKKLVEL